MVGSRCHGKPLSSWIVTLVYYLDSVAFTLHGSPCVLYYLNVDSSVDVDSFFFVKGVIVTEVHMRIRMFV